MSSARPKKNNSPINSKHQPLKATAPISSLVRTNGSPTRRRTSPSSPVPPEVVRGGRYRRSPDGPYTNDHRTLVSPLGKVENKVKPIIKQKDKTKEKDKDIRRTNSLETLSYINGQWPAARDGSSNSAVSTPSPSIAPVIATPICRLAQAKSPLPYVSSAYSNKYTQTPSRWDQDSPSSEEPVQIPTTPPVISAHRRNSPAEEPIPLAPAPGIRDPGNHRRSSSFGNADSKEKFRQCLAEKRTKQQQPIHDKQSPLQGNHSAFYQYFPHHKTKPVDIPPRVPSSPKNPSLHTRRSVEGLNVEIEGLELGAETFYARTPPEGRCPPVPVAHRNVNMQTQTGHGWVDSSDSGTSTMKSMGTSTCEDVFDKRSQSTSPSFAVPLEQKTPTKNQQSFARSYSADSVVPPSKSTQNDSRPGSDDSPVTGGGGVGQPKYAYSPKPNNTYLFARGPPDGAEKVNLSVEDIERSLKEAVIASNSYSCPDTSKGRILFSENSAFRALPCANPDYS